MEFFSFWSNLIQSRRYFCSASWKRSFVSAFFLKVSIHHLCDNLESGKRNCCFWKKSGKVCIQKSERTLQLAFWPSITEILPALPNLWEIIVDLNLWWEFVKFVYTSVADPGEGPGGFRPNRGPKGRKNFFGRPPPAPLSNGLEDRPPPPPPPPHPSPFPPSQGLDPALQFPF